MECSNVVAAGGPDAGAIVVMNSEQMRERMAQVRASKERRRQAEKEKAAGGPRPVADAIVEALLEGEGLSIATLAKRIGCSTRAVANNIRILHKDRRVKAVQAEQPEGARGMPPMLYSLTARGYPTRKRPTAPKHREAAKPAPAEPAAAPVVVREAARAPTATSRPRSVNLGPVRLRHGLEQLNALTLRRTELEAELREIERKQIALINRIAAANPEPLGAAEEEADEVEVIEPEAEAEDYSEDYEEPAELRQYAEDNGFDDEVPADGAGEESPEGEEQQG